MEPVAGVLYGVEKVVEGAAAFAKGIIHPTLPLKATYKQIKAPSIPRSSHSLSVVKDRAYIFGGELKPRSPVDNEMHMIVLPSSDFSEADYQVIPAVAADSDAEVPPPRLGHTAAVVGHHIYVFGGRGGSNMTALEEHGRIWAFDTLSKTWSHLDPNPQSGFPPPRSYHASVATEHPLPTSIPNVANVLLDEPPDSAAELQEPPAPHSYGTIFIHAGCLTHGRTSDLWAFDISSRSWAQFPSAPDPGRGGTALAIVKDRLYRFGGFDGTNELGGQVDYLDLLGGSFDDKGGKGNMALSPVGEWQSNVFPPAGGSHSIGSENDSDTSYHSEPFGPKPRSVAGLLPVTTGQGRNYLLVFGGEQSPSDGGHEKAGKFLSDAWALQLKPEGMTAASFKDATRLGLKWSTGEGEAKEVRYFDSEGVMIQENQERPMSARGWFACSTAEDYGGSGSNVILWGGVGNDNERLGDGWIIEVS